MAMKEVLFSVHASDSTQPEDGWVVVAGLTLTKLRQLPHLIVRRIRIDAQLASNVLESVSNARVQIENPAEIQIALYRRLYLLSFNPAPREKGKGAT